MLLHQSLAPVFINPKENLSFVFCCKDSKGLEMAGVGSNFTMPASVTKKYKMGDEIAR